MASRYADNLRYSRGIPVETWFETHFLAKKARESGLEIPGIGPFNSTVMIIHDRSELNDQTSRLYDQGSPTPTGKIYGFANGEEAFIDIFKDRFAKKYHLQNVFCLPLIYNIEYCDDLWVWIQDCSANFVKGRMGNNEHSATHVATAYSSVLAAICYQLAESMVLNYEKCKYVTDRKPDLLTGDAERHMLYDALKWITHTIRVLIEYSPDVKAIFETLAMAYQTPDTLQSLNATYLLRQNNDQNMVAYWIYLSYMRYLRYSKTRSFITDFPVGLTALMVVSPLIFHEQERDRSWTEAIGQIIESVDQALKNANRKFASGEIATDHDLRTTTMTAYCDTVRLISSDLIPQICEAVEVGKSFASIIPPLRLPWMIDSTPMINGRAIDNAPYITHHSSNQFRVIGGDSSNWSAICFRPGTSVDVKIYSLGCKTQIGNTAGKGRIQNVRFGSTFDPHNMDIMKGQKGVSTSGQVYYPEMDRFKPYIQLNNIDISGKWNVRTTNGLVVSCNNKSILVDSSPYSPENSDDSVYTNDDRHAMIAFKNCYLVISLNVEYSNLGNAGC